MNQLHYPNEKELMLEPRWFTGQEWADGTAQHELKREFIAAVKSYNKVKVIWIRARRSPCQCLSWRSDERLGN